jgi:cobalt transporter subunit CbtB
VTTRSLPATPAAGSTDLSQTRTTVGAIALLLGLSMIFLVGFAPVSAVHNAAHDTRHSAAFPCH